MLISPNNTAGANGYDYVDMGEAGVWATCNIGAKNPWDYGLYFAWGETKGYANASDKPGGFVWSTTKYWVSGTSYSSKWLKYTATDESSSTGVADNKTTLELEDDAAHINMGGSWRMPTSAEFQKLYDACNTSWVTDYNGTGVTGRLFTLKKDSSKQLFFPATGEASGTFINSEGEYGGYRSSSLSTTNSSSISCLGFTWSDIRPNNGSNRFDGQTIRGILDNSDRLIDTNVPDNVDLIIVDLREYSNTNKKCKIYSNNEYYTSKCHLGITLYNLLVDGGPKVLELWNFSNEPTFEDPTVSIFDEVGIDLIVQYYKENNKREASGCKYQIREAPDGLFMDDIPNPRFRFIFPSNEVLELDNTNSYVWNDYGE